MVAVSPSLTAVTLLVMASVGARVSTAITGVRPPPPAGEAVGVAAAGDVIEARPLTLAPA
jgi:hypothetical protein